MASKLPSLNQEIWDHITKYLSSLSAWHAASIFFFKPQSAETGGHGRIWCSIFQKDTWARKITENGIRIALIGPQLHTFHDQDQTHKPDHHFMVLHCEPWNYRTNMHLDLLFQCLNEHEYDGHSKRVEFADNVVLDIATVFTRLEWHCIEPDPTLLFSWTPTSFESFYTFWDNDQNALHKLGPESVVGTSGFVREKEQVSYIYGLHLFHPSGSKFQITFCRDDLEDHETATGHQICKRAGELDFGEGKVIEGWDLIGVSQVTSNK